MARAALIRSRMEIRTRPASAGPGLCREAPVQLDLGGLGRSRRLSQRPLRAAAREFSVSGGPPRAAIDGTFHVVGGLRSGDRPPEGLPCMELSCIVCAYNEGARLRDILRAWTSTRPCRRSSSSMWFDRPILEAFVRAHPAFRIVSNTANCGRAFAMSRASPGHRRAPHVSWTPTWPASAARRGRPARGPGNQRRADVSISLRPEQPASLSEPWVGFRFPATR